MTKKVTIITFSLIIAITLLLFLLNYNYITDLLNYSSDPYSKPNNSDVTPDSKNPETSPNGNLDNETVTEEYTIDDNNDKYPLEPLSNNSSNNRVLNYYGNPVPNATITIIKISDDLRDDYLNSDDYSNYLFESHELLTDINGCFDIPDLESSLYLIHAERENYGPGHIELDARYKLPTDIEIKLTIEKIINGQVVDINGDPFLMFW